MTDPLTLVALGAAVGGAAGKFVEKAWDSGERWVATYFADHRPKAIEKAQENSADFLNDLANRIKALEDQGIVTRVQIETAQEQPDFSVALQKALLTAAQTDDRDKHQLLARILAERLAATPDGLRAMASKIACDAVGYMTPNQLRLLGLSAELYCVVPQEALSDSMYQQWLMSRYASYTTVTFTQLDLLHLESLSCLKHMDFLSHDLEEMLKRKNSGTFDQAVMAVPVLAHIKSLWGQGLQAIVLTSVGQLLGVYVSDSLTGSNTAFVGWD